MNYDDEKRRPRRSSPTVTRPPQQRGRCRPRDPDEREALTRLSQAKWDLYLASGKLEILGPRKWRLHLGQEKIVEYLRRQTEL